MAQTRQNKVVTITNDEQFDLATHLARLADSIDVAIRVSSTAERDALTKYLGMSVKRMDLAGMPIETWDGTLWQGINFVPYSPSFAGWANLGSGAVQTGSYLLVGKMCTVRAKLVSGGTGQNMGTGALAISLPFVSAADQATIGDCIWYGNGAGSGNAQRLMLANPANNIQASLQENVSGASVARTPGQAGFGYGPNTEAHCNITYRIA